MKQNDFILSPQITKAEGDQIEIYTTLGLSSSILRSKKLLINSRFSHEFAKLPRGITGLANIPPSQFQNSMTGSSVLVANASAARGPTSSN